MEHDLIYIDEEEETYYDVGMTSSESTMITSDMTMTMSDVYETPRRRRPTLTWAPICPTADSWILTVSNKLCARFWDSCATVFSN